MVTRTSTCIRSSVCPGMQVSQPGSLQQQDQINTRLLLAMHRTAISTLQPANVLPESEPTCMPPTKALRSPLRMRDVRSVPCAVPTMAIPRWAMLLIARASCNQTSQTDANDVQAMAQCISGILS
jgi:hypothetical protein